MTKEEMTRELLNKYIEKHGSSVTHIAVEIGIARETLSRFRTNKRKLADPVLDKLMDYLIKNI